MATVKWFIDLKTAAQIAADTRVLEINQPVWRNDGYVAFTDGVTQVNALTFKPVFSLIWGAITGTVSNQTDLVTYIATELATPVRDCGTFDYSGNTFPTTGGTGTAGAILKGNFFNASVSSSALGMPGGRTITAPDSYARALVDNPGQTAVNWYIFNTSVPVPAPSNLPRSTSITSSATPTINTDLYDCFSITALAADITSMTTNLSGTPVNFQPFILRVKPTALRLVTWGAKFIAMGETLPASFPSGKVTQVAFLYDTVLAKWGCVGVKNES